jgi:Ni,Fe-hydrogenase III small subunit
VDGKSCFSNLLETVDSIIELREAGCPVDIFYFDFCKFFDSVPHYRLLIKLENCGINGPLLYIVRDFLSGRILRISVTGCYSSTKNVISGSHMVLY